MFKLIAYFIAHIQNSVDTNTQVKKEETSQQSNDSTQELDTKIKEQGELIRKLKASKASKVRIS